jgi:hypothetical protein
MHGAGLTQSKQQQQGQQLEHHRGALPWGSPAVFELAHAGLYTGGWPTQAGGHSLGVCDMDIVHLLHGTTEHMFSVVHG